MKLHAALLALAFAGIPPAAATLAAVPPAAAPVDAGRTMILLPAGAMLVGHVVDGAWRVDVAPALASDDGAADCANDVPAAPWGAPSHFALMPDLLWPAVPNAASVGACDGSHVFQRGVNVLQFRTAGDVGGAVSLYGAGGTFSIVCRPVGVRVAAGAGGQFPDAGEVQDAECTVTQSGTAPPDYASWWGEVSNANRRTGMSTYAAVL